MCEGGPPTIPVTQSMETLQTQVLGGGQVGLAALRNSLCSCSPQPSSMKSESRSSAEDDDAGVEARNMRNNKMESEGILHFAIPEGM